MKTEEEVQALELVLAELESAYASAKSTLCILIREKMGINSKLSLWTDKLKGLGRDGSEQQMAEARHTLREITGEDLDRRIASLHATHAEIDSSITRLMSHLELVEAATTRVRLDSRRTIVAFQIARLEACQIAAVSLRANRSYNIAKSGEAFSRAIDLLTDAVELVRQLSTSNTSDPDNPSQ